MISAEKAALLQATKVAPRNYGLYLMTLSTGLCLRELLGLNVGDVSADTRDVRRRG